MRGSPTSISHELPRPLSFIFKYSRLLNCSTCDRQQEEHGHGTSQSVAGFPRTVKIYLSLPYIKAREALSTLDQIKNRIQVMSKS